MGAREKRKKERVDLRNAVGNWVEGKKKERDSDRSLGRLLGIGGWK